MLVFVIYSIAVGGTLTVIFVMWLLVELSNRKEKNRDEKKY